MFIYLTEKKVKRIMYFVLHLSVVLDDNEHYCLKFRYNCNLSRKIMYGM